MSKKYDRYALLRREGSDMEPMPFVKIPEALSDKYERWHRGVSRMDRMSQKYYGSPIYGFFILFANPEYMTEWDIPDYATIRIPFPLSRVKEDYEAIIEKKIGTF